jgi:hypothetical protein
MKIARSRRKRRSIVTMSHKFYSIKFGPGGAELIFWLWANATPSTVIAITIGCIFMVRLLNINS